MKTKHKFITLLKKAARKFRFLLINLLQLQMNLKRKRREEKEEDAL